MQAAPTVNVEASRQARQEKQKSRYRERGGIFVPAETNPLVDILRAKWIHSPIKRTSPRKARQPSSSPSRLQQIGTSGAIEGAVEPRSNDARTKVPRKTKPKASSKAVLKNKKQVGRKSQVSRDEGEQPQPEAGPSRPKKAPANKKTNTKGKSKVKSKQPAVDLELREGDPNELSIAEAKSVRNPRKKKDAVELPDLPVPEAPKEARKTTIKRQREEDDRDGNSEPQASPAPRKRAKAVKVKPKAKGIRSQEVEPTSDGGGHASDHPEGESGAQSEDVQVKDRGRGKRKAVDISREKDGNGPSTFKSSLEMRDPHPQERPPGVKTKHSKKKTFTLDSDDEDDIPLVVRSLKPPPNKQGKKRKAPSEDPDEEPFQTMEIPPEVTPAVGKPAKRPKKLKPSEAASEKYAKENIPESRRKQSQKPKEVPVQVTPSSPPPGVLGTQDADPDSPAKNGTKQKAKRERKAFVNQDNETHEEEPAQQTVKSTSRSLKENTRNSNSKRDKDTGRILVTKKLYARKPKPRLSLFPAPEVMYVSDEDPIDMLS